MMTHANQAKLELVAGYQTCLKEQLKTKYKVTKTINSKFLLEIGLLCQACFANFPLTRLYTRLFLNIE